MTPAVSKKFIRKDLSPGSQYCFKFDPLRGRKNIATHFPRMSPRILDFDAPGILTLRESLNIQTILASENAFDTSTVFVYMNCRCSGIQGKEYGVYISF